MRVRRIGAIVATWAVAATMGATTALAAPPAPTDLHVDATGSTQAALAWAKPSGGASITGYEVLRNGTKVGTTDQYTTTFVDTKPSAGTYTYKVVSLAGSEKSSPSEALDVEIPSTSAVHALSSCQSAPLPAGHYVLESNLVVGPGHPCIQFESPEAVSLDCENHTIAEEVAPTSPETGLVINGVHGFLVINCTFYNPDAESRQQGFEELLRVTNSTDGVVQGDHFSSGQGNAAIRASHDESIAFIGDTLSDVVFEQGSDEHDYVGQSSITHPHQISTGESLSLNTGKENVLDDNIVAGDAGFTNTYPAPGVDDAVLASSETGDVVVNNVLTDAWDCGYETENLSSHAYIARNVMDNDWAAGICSYWETSWLENTVLENAVLYSGDLLALDGASKLAFEQSTNYFLGNTFERNTLSHSSPDYFGNSTNITGWNGEPVPTVVGNNAFVENNFGESTPAPVIDQTQPPIVARQAGNQCQLPSPDLECGMVTGSSPAPPPRVAGIYPTAGPPSGGTLVSIEGSGFTGASEARFGGTPGRIVKILADSRLVAEAPPGATGPPVDVTVTTPVGSSPSTPADQFEYASIPVVGSVSPSRGPVAGETPVTITGSGFTGATAVYFGSTIEHACGSPPCFTVKSPTSITAVSEPAPAPRGFVNVTVATPSGTSQATEGISEEATPSASDRFTLAPAPKIQRVRPSVGSEAGGAMVVISGEYLAETSKVTFGGEPGSQVVNKSANEVTVTSPPHPGAGTVGVQVTTPGGVSMPEETATFTYGAPAVTAIHPSGGVSTGGTPVAITGERLQEVEKVTFGTEPAKSFVVNSPTSITAVSPPHAKGPVALTVKTPAGTSAETPAGVFTYVEGRPVVNTVSPSSGGEGGNTSVTVTGHNFEDVESVTFGLAKGSNIEVLKPTELRVKTPPGTGPVNVSVMNPVNTSEVTSVDRYTYSRGSGIGRPTVTNVQPNAGPVGGGTRVLLSGTNFQGASQVIIGGAQASFTVDSATMISAVTPVGSRPETVDIMVGTPSGLSAAVPADKFSYRQAGVPVAWGANESGQLGDGNSENTSLPTQALGTGEALAGSGGQAFSLALMKGGRVEAYGENGSGQLGTGNTQSSNKPVEIAGLSEVTAVTAGAQHAMALKTSGRVFAWGDNQYGELGDGSPSNILKPEEVSALKEPAIAIAAGGSQTLRPAAEGDFSLALMQNGTVEAWGYNGAGQLGNGSTESSSTPVEVKGLREVVAVAAGNGFALALLRNGTVKAWGSDAHGQLGDGGGATETEPVAVSGLSEVSAIAAGGAHALALLANGTIKAWGWNFVGQLGNGTTVESKVPTPLSEPTEATAVAADDSHSVALQRTGTAKAWGENNYGELGAGSTSGTCGFFQCSKLPVSVKEFPSVAAIGVGAHHTLGAGIPVPRVTGISPGSGLENAETSVTIGGANFDGATEVKFGQKKASSVTVVSESTIIAKSPTGTGVVDVTVTTPGGTSQTSAADHFSYLVSELSQGLRFSAPVKQSSELALTLPTGSGFQFNAGVVSGAVGHKAKIALATKEPAFEPTTPGHYRSISGGVDVEAETRYANGEQAVGPLQVACSVPESITFAEIPITATAGSETKPYESIPYQTECILAPGVLDSKFNSTITMYATGPKAVETMHTVTITAASFTLTVPKELKEEMYAQGGRELRGKSTSSASAVMTVE